MLNLNVESSTKDLSQINYVLGKYLKGFIRLRFWKMLYTSTKNVYNIANNRVKEIHNLISPFS